MYAKKNSGKKVAAMLLAVVMLIGVGVGGTLAWLSATSETVTNTFTVGNVIIELKEHDLKEDGILDKDKEVTQESAYKIVPGDTQPKDPFVRVKANSEDSWIFVQVQEVNNSVNGNTNASKYVEWTIRNGWTMLGSTENGVSTYYKNYATKGTDEIFYVLEGDATKNVNGYVSYNDNLTTKDLNAVTETTKPQLIFKAFAVQKEAGESADAAWSVIDANQKLGYEDSTN